MPKKKEPDPPEDDYTFPNQITFDDLLADQTASDIIEEEEPPCQRKPSPKASPS